MAIEKDQFDVVILDAEKLIRKHDVVNTGDAWHTRYRVDYSAPWDRRWYTKSINLLNDNALFFQIRDICDLQLTGQKKYDRGLLKEYIVYVDFDSFFKKLDRLTNQKDPYETSYAEKDLANTGDTKYDEFKIKEIIDQGVYIRFDETEDFQKFVPLDKSNSMSKKSTLSFVREDLKFKLDARLNLNIDFSQIEVQHSKYYAYRGLYLTDARRVCCEDISLNCNSVIVIKDWSVSVHAKAVTGDKENNYSLKPDAPEIKISELFDGEGIISPFFAEKIADDLELYITNTDEPGRHFKQKATSFQIRLPFGKGMLHSVDFKDFIRKYGNVNGKCFFITDAFGYRRNLLEAEIILPESMLKCKSCLKEAIKKLSKGDAEELHILEEQYKGANGGELKDDIDPMWFYFYQFESCKHALYIANTNLSYGRGSKIKLGYQFLNTLKLSMEDLDTYTEQTKKYVNDPISYLRDCEDISDDEDDDDDHKDANFKVNLWKRALFKNPNFALESKVKRELRSISYSIMQEYAYGRFLIDGEVRILSRDLLEFLIQLLRLEDEKNSNIVLLEGKRMYLDSFYMPFANVKVNPREYYAVLRNPHLSRNEQCALTPYLGGDIYKEYFGELRGIIMVAYDALDPMALGGADFDGDIIKFIYDKRINNAVLEANYVKREKKKGYIYKRSKEIININGPKGTKEKVPEHITYKLIKNTFANKVGVISNRAIGIGKKQYYAEDHGEPYTGPKCEECTILTGLEIDAAKTGVHPDLSILGKENNKERGYIKDFKTPYDENFVGAGNSKISKTNIGLNEGVYQVVKYKKDKEDEKPDYIIEYPIIEEDYLLGKIPEYFFEMVRHFGESKSDKKEGVFFEFQQNVDWENRLITTDSEYIELRRKVSAIVFAYRKVHQINNSLNRWNKKRNNRKTFAGHTHNTLEWQYDMPIFEEKWLLVDQVMTILDNTFIDEDEVKEAIDLFKEKKWAFSLPEEKEQVIKEIFYQWNYPDELIDIVSNFWERGYKLLYYILQDLRSMKIDEVQNTEYLDQKADRFEQEIPEECDKEEYDSFYKEIYKLYHDMISDEKSGAIKALLEETVVRVEKILSGKDVQFQLMLLYSLKGNIDKDSEFFWAYFKSEMLEFVGGAASC